MEELSNDVSNSVSINHILGKYEAEQGNLIPVLQDLQDEFGCISEDCISQISQEWQIPVIKIVGLVTFHREFNLQLEGFPQFKKAENTILVCSGSPCKVKKSDVVIRGVREVLKIEDGETTTDGKISFQVVDCLGACGMSPVMMINETMHGNLTVETTISIVEELQRQVLAKNG